MFPHYDLNAHEEIRGATNIDPCWIGGPLSLYSHFIPARGGGMEDRKKTISSFLTAIDLYEGIPLETLVHDIGGCGFEFLRYPGICGK